MLLQLLGRYIPPADYVEAFIPVPSLKSASVTERGRSCRDQFTDPRELGQVPCARPRARPLESDEGQPEFEQRLRPRVREVEAAREVRPKLGQRIGNDTRVDTRECEARRGRWGPPRKRGAVS